MNVFPVCCIGRFLNSFLSFYCFLMLCSGYCVVELSCHHFFYGDQGGCKVIATGALNLLIKRFPLAIVLIKFKGQHIDLKTRK